MTNFPQSLDHSTTGNASMSITKLRKLVKSNTARWRRIVLFQALGIAVAVPLAFGLVMLWLDNMLHLPVWGRLLGLVGFVGLTVAMFVRLVKQWRGLKLTEDQVALSIEQQAPEGLENRLINALQLDRDSDKFDPAVARAVVQENCQHLSRLKLQPAVQLAPAMLGLGLALAVIAVGTAFWSINATYFTNAAQRLFMPFANIDPIYETVLGVEPGNVDVDRGANVALTINAERQVPDYVRLSWTTNGESHSTRLPVDSDTNTATHTFSNVRNPITYSVSGGDFTSDQYAVSVPVPARLSVLEAELDFPDYTGAANETRRQRRGGLEALYGTEATLRFELTGPAKEASIVMEKPHGSVSDADQANVQSNGTTQTTVRRSLRKVSDTVFVGDLTFRNVLAYRLETHSQSGYTHTSERYRINVQGDQAPSMTLSGLDGRREVAVDATLGLTVKATDDFGLEKVGLFVRDSGMATPTPTPSSQNDAQQGDAQQRSEDQWRPVQTWSVSSSDNSFEKDHNQRVVELPNAIEGQRLILAMRAIDNAPARNGEWVTGPVYQLTIGGHGAELQRMYLRILETEKALEQLVEDQDALISTTIDWNNKLQPGSGMRWDDQENLDALAKAMGGASSEQAALRERAGAVARDMVMEVSHLQRSLAMLADTEMIKSRQILDAVANRESPSEKRSALSDAKVTQERTVKSLQKMLEEYRKFRRDWELANMMAFLQMLGERQERMSATSEEYASKSGNVDQALAASMLQRQKKVRELVGLSQTAFEGMATRTEEVGQIMTDAFAQAGKTLATEQVTGPMQRAEQALQPASWSNAADAQSDTASALLAVHAKLEQAKNKAAQQAMEEIRQQQKELNAQGDIEKLNEGSLKGLLNTDPSKLTLSEVVEMRNVGKDVKEKFEKAEVGEYDNFFTGDEDGPNRQGKDKGVEQDPSIIKLAEEPSGYSQFSDDYTPGERNQVSPLIQEDVTDVVGDLLESVETVTDQYATVNRTKATQMNEPGAPTPGAHEMNQTSASAPTGNQKPGPQNAGGAARAGRQGARQYGSPIGDELHNRRGRNQAQEGDLRAPDTPGEMQEIMTDDPQTDMSTGLGGKDVVSDRPNKFNTGNTDEWIDDTVKHMQAPNKTRLLVERATGEIDPDVAQALRDLTSQQEQVVKRVKRLRKELDKMYLPTDQLADIEKELEANLELLKKKPDADVFRKQQAALNELQTVAVRFQRAAANFQPSLRREQRVEGRILDQPAGEPIPGYDEAVKRYYEKLANQ